MATLILRPNGNSSVQWSRYGDSPNYANVDDSSADDLATHNYIIGTGQTGYSDVFTFPNHTSETGTINSVIAYIRGIKHHAGDHYHILINGSPSGELGGGSVWATQSWNPGGSWTWTDIDNIVAGYVGHIFTSDLLRVTQLYLSVDYTPATVPTVTTTAISAIKARTATSGGNVTSEGGASVTAKGVCWNTAGTPTIADSKTSDGTGLGAYSSAITGLSPRVTYHVRAYATSSIGTGYGAEVDFTALAGAPQIVMF